MYLYTLKIYFYLKNIYFIRLQVEYIFSGTNKEIVGHVGGAWNAIGMRRMISHSRM